MRITGEQLTLRCDVLGANEAADAIPQPRNQGEVGEPCSVVESLPEFELLGHNSGSNENTQRSDSYSVYNASGHTLQSLGLALTSYTANYF
jgi:hypothetical protein